MGGLVPSYAVSGNEIPLGPEPLYGPCATGFFFIRQAVENKYLMASSMFSFSFSFITCLEDCYRFHLQQKGV